MVTWDKALEAIRNSHPDSKVYVGCDSVTYRHRKTKEWYAAYSTVVILHRGELNGCNLFSHTEVLRDYGNLKQRLLTEVGFAIDAAMEIKDHLDGRHMEVHCDINPAKEHKSSVAVSEAIGYVQGMLGDRPILKPDGFAATHAGDHVARYKTGKHKR